MKCVVCGKPNAKKVIDPYEADVNNREVWIWICPEDFQELLDDI